jgi:hypothetical protein
MPVGLRIVKTLCRPLGKLEAERIVMQVFVHKCLNKLLCMHGKKQQSYMIKAAIACHNEGLIYDTTLDYCHAINQMGNFTKHEAVKHAIDELKSEFGSPTK